MRTSARNIIPTFLLPILLLLAACAPGAGRSSPTLNNIPSGISGTPEPGTNGAPQPAPNGHSESIIATADLAFVGSDNQTLYAIGTRDGKVRWQYKMGDAVWVYAVADGVVYAAAGSVLSALNASTGALLWKYQAAQPLAQVLASNGMIYADTDAEGNTSTLVALDAATGTPRWHFALSTMTPALQGVVNGMVYVYQVTGDPGGPDSRETISALRASDGHLLWKAALNGADGLASGAPVAANGIVYFSTSSGALYAFDAATGQLRWHVAPPGEVPPAPVPASPVVVNGLVYVGGSQGLAAYRASDGARQWQYAMMAPGPFPPQPMVADGVVYAGANSQVVALRASDGSVIWQQRVPGPVQSLTLYDGLLISDAGSEFALRASNGALVWQRAVTPSGIGRFGGGSAVTVSAGVVYIGGDDGKVTAMQASNGNLLWQYAIRELPVQTPPVYDASATFAPNVSYEQALEVVTSLGLKTFVACGGKEQSNYSSSHLLLVAAQVNSAPLWLGRLKTTQGVTDAQAINAVFSCPAMPVSNGPPPIPQDQVGAYVRVAFSSATAYAVALDRVNALGFRLADPCYEQARAQGKKPTWHPMSETDTYNQTYALVLATTLYNDATWPDQLKAVAGVVKINVPFTAACQ
jgi:outer membrane protein assembly factor BamB